MAEALAGKRRFNGVAFANALLRGAGGAYAAVAKPVEGTILTVIRESADAAVQAAERTTDLEVVLTVTVAAARKSVARTPRLLSILREAGVVDAGGQGLFRLFEGALFSLQGRAPATPDRRAAAAAPSALVAHADEGFGYETMFLLQAAPAKQLDPDGIRDHLESIGESVLVAGDALAIKVHVHSERPDEVLAYGLSLGSLSRISIENLDNQTRDVREQRAADFAGDGVEAPDEDPPTTDTVEALGGSSDERDGVGPAIVAVVAGDGLAAVFEEFGVQQILRGGQSENPSTGELLRVARLARQREVLLLPNNPNVRLAAEQAALLCDDKRLVVVPTRNAAEGLAALLALDPTRDAATNAGPMTEASRAIQTMQVTEAVRDARMGRKKVKKGQTIVLDPDDGLIAAGSEVEPTVLDALGHLEPGFELVTIYYGADATLGEAEALARKVGEAAAGAEVEVIHGGQPHYRYLIAAE
jgi:DAK2 domain fusion protein YloV